ncbi:hypothetical protein [Janthinobacterium sp.]|uniref:hypothetical protein n=1 Tax=Janthinobacterium sp. TaxID=1871054 RepID=UPI002587E853|nr:hypothetical protein [Janthinobacterium sp.]MCX7289571.1 hypothetical protein [Janthinobacterium sp.]
MQKRIFAWKVGVSIEPRYIAYALPASLDQVSSPTAASKVLRADSNAMAVLNGIWDPSRSFQESLMAASLLLLHIIQNSDTSLNKMAAPMDIWCAKSKLRPESVSSIENIALVVAWTAMHLAENDLSFSMQLRRVYFALVEMEHGDKMDEGKEKDATIFLRIHKLEDGFDKSFGGKQTASHQNRFRIHPRNQRRGRICPRILTSIARRCIKDS